MAATGKTPILLYGSTTATNTPSSGNLTNSSDGCEIAINVADKNLFFKDSTNAVNTVPIRQSSGSSDGWLSSANWTTFNSKQTAYTNLTTIGSLANATGWLYNNGSGTFSYSTPSASDVGAVPTTRTISTTSPLAGGGDLSANRTLSITQATTSTSGYLSSTDWNTFNNKQPAGTYVTSVTGTAPVVSSGGTTPAISMAAANGSTNGYLTSTDWTTFNGKAPAFTYTTGYIPFGQGTTTPTQDSALFWDNTNKRIGLGTSTPATTINASSATTNGTGDNFGLIQATYTGTSTISASVTVKNYYGTSQFMHWENKGLRIGTRILTNGGVGDVVFTSGADSEKMRIFSSGGVSIGNTTDPGAANLSVTGNVLVGNTTSYNPITNKQIRVTGATTPAFLVLDRGNTQVGDELARIIFGSGLADNRYSSIAAFCPTGVSGVDKTDLRFYTINGGSSGPTERARIDNLGNFLLGTTDPIGYTGLIMGAGKTIVSPGVYASTTGGAANVYVGADGSLNRSTSSLKYKQKITDATHGLSELLTLRPVTYESKNSKEQGIVYGGLIAEEVHDAGLTEFVQYAEDGTPDALAYGNMISLCIKAIQEQQQQINQLRSEINFLKGY